MKKIRVLFVCLGNICRSPLAEAIFKHQVRKRGLEGLIEADSCGTSNYHIGSAPDPRTLANASQNGIPIDHCGRQLSNQDLEQFDFILAMDESNLRNILRSRGAKEYANKIMLLRDFDPFSKGDVPDPYFGAKEGFQEVFDILSRSLEGFMAFLEKEIIRK